MAAKGGNTSNLFRHLLVGHGMDLNPCTIFKKMDSTQPRLFAATATPTPPPPTGPGLPGKAVVPIATAVVVPSLNPRLPTLPSLPDYPDIPDMTLGRFYFTIN